MGRRSEPKPACPSCGATEALPILYGLPSAEGIEKFERGEVALGGCCIAADMPRFECAGCGTRYRLHEPAIENEKVP